MLIQFPSRLSLIVRLAITIILSIVISLTHVFVDFQNEFIREVVIHKSGKSQLELYENILQEIILFNPKKM